MEKNFSLTGKDLLKDAKIPFLLLNESGEVFYELALTMIHTIEQNNAQNTHSVLIVPVGPIGQYPVFVRLVNQQQLDLKSCWFINMDEYLDNQGQWLPKENTLSFRGYMESQVYSQIDKHLLPPPDQRIFPDPLNPEKLDNLLSSLGEADLCIGGIGLNGHVAFNEPKPELTIEEYSELGSRVLEIAPETRTTNCIAGLSGSLEEMPTHCVTIGIKQILMSKKIVLGVFRDWHRAVLRRALHGKKTTAFPVTLLQNHPNTLIISNKTAAG